MQFCVLPRLLLLVLKINRMSIPVSLAIGVAAVSVAVCIRGGAAVLALGTEQILIRNLWRTHRIGLADITTFALSRCVVAFRLLDRVYPSCFVSCLEVRAKSEVKVRVLATMCGIRLGGFRGTTECKGGRGLITSNSR